jgi:hypothetical protein
MTRRGPVLLFCLGLAFVAPMPLAWAQGELPRIKGRIVDFDGLTFHLAPEKGPQLAIRLQAKTLFMSLEKRTLSAFKVGAYAGATTTQTEGGLVADEVHIYPDAMRGSSEGRINLGGNRQVVSGAVTANGNGTLTLFYRGSRLEGGVCLGRAGPAASPACTADPVIHVPAQARVTALVPADRRLLVPGAIATVTVETDAKGARSTPGLILEKP